MKDLQESILDDESTSSSNAFNDIIRRIAKQVFHDDEGLTINSRGHVEIDNRNGVYSPLVFFDYDSMLKDGVDILDQNLDNLNMKDYSKYVLKHGSPRDLPSWFIIDKITCEKLTLVPEYCNNIKLPKVFTGTLVLGFSGTIPSNYKLPVKINGDLQVNNPNYDLSMIKECRHISGSQLGKLIISGVKVPKNDCIHIDAHNQEDEKIIDRALAIGLKAMNIDFDKAYICVTNAISQVTRIIDSKRI